MTFQENPPPGSIVITPQEVYSEVKKLTSVVERMLAQQEGDTTRADIAELRAEVRTLQQFRWTLLGGALAAGATGGAAVARLFGIS